MADLSTLQSRLTEAENAYHQLAIGAMQVQVQDADAMVQFTPANMSRLAAYIDRLKGEIAALGGSTSGSSKRKALVVNL